MTNPTIDLLRAEIADLTRDYNALKSYCTELEHNHRAQKSNLLLKKKKIESYEETIRLIEQAEAQV